MQPILVRCMVTRALCRAQSVPAGPLMPHPGLPPCARRYELQAEYKIPETSSIPSSPIHVASTLGAPGAEAEGEPAPWQGPGQWKVKVTVPGAELEEILPAARLLSAATGEQPVDYEKAKGRFLEVRPPRRLKRHPPPYCRRSFDPWPCLHLPRLRPLLLLAWRALPFSSTTAMWFRSNRSVRIKETCTSSPKYAT